MVRLRGEARREAREALHEALVRDGRWLSAREAREAYVALYGVDPRVGGWAWLLPVGVPCLTMEQTGALLQELRADGRVEMRQRKRQATRRWRAVEPELVPDTFPSEWARELVLA